MIGIIDSFPRENVRSLGYGRGERGEKGEEQSMGNRNLGTRMGRGINN